MTDRLSACSTLFAAVLMSGCVGVTSSKNFRPTTSGTTQSQAPTQSASLASLKTCTRGNPINPQTLSGDCTAYPSPNDPKPLVYDGTPVTVYKDPVFGTKIKRLTPQPGMPVGGYAPKYAPYESWSKNGTYLILSGPGGGAYLFKGTDPYTYIRQVSLPPFDGVDEYYYQWSNTNDCFLIIVNSNEIQTINVCNNDALTTDATFTQAADTQGNTILFANLGGLVLKPYIYCGISQDDTKIATKLVDGGGRVYGFGLISMNLSAGTASMAWFHKIYAPGDLVENEAPADKLPASACISDSGNYVAVSWNTIYAGRETTISSIADNNGTVTVTGQSAWPSGITVGSTITIDNVPDSFYNGQFTVAAMPDGTHLTYSLTGTHSPSSGGYVDYKWYGTEAFNANDGSFLAQISQADAHSDEILLGDGTEAVGGGYVTQNHDDYRRFEAYEYSTGSLFNAYMPDSFFGPQWHFSGRGSASSNGRKGWALISTYSESQQVDCSPQTVMCAEIVAVNMNNSNTFYRIAHVQSIQCDPNGCQYYDEPHATPNRDFTKVIWGSDWRTFSNAMDVYLVELQ
jgi:hypothetical protein